MAVGALVVAVGAYAWWRRANDPSRVANPASVTGDARCLPYQYDPGAVSATVEAYLDAGERDPALVAVNTASHLFGDHPTAGRVVFPPAPESPSHVHCVFDHVLGVVDGAFVRRGIGPNDFSKSTGVDWSVVRIGPDAPDVGSYPWSRPILHGEPAPGTFYQVRPGDGEPDLWRRLLANALIMAGVDSQLAFEDTKMSRHLRKELREATLAAPFNDLRVTSTSATMAGGRDPGTHGREDRGVTHVLGAQGRGLVWAECHFDDAERLERGLPAKRGVALDGRPISSARCAMLLWFPAVSLRALRGPAPTILVEDLWPETQTSTLHPPPSVARLGVDSGDIAVEMMAA